MNAKDILERYHTVSLEEMKRVKRMNRTDTKFVTTENQLMRLLILAGEDYLAQSIGGSSPASGINCDNSTSFTISGGEVVALRGSLDAKPTRTTTNRRIWTGLNAFKGSAIDIIQDSKSLYPFAMPRTFEGGVLLIANTSLPVSGSLSVCFDSRQVGNQFD